MSCPATGASSGACPSTGLQGPRGCAFLGMAQSSSQTLYGAPQGPNHINIALQRERQTLCDLVLPNAPPKELTGSKSMLNNADSLNPPEIDILALAMGAPARRVLERADRLGPITGWRDGFLSTKKGLVPPDLNVHAAALAHSPGRVWSDICGRMTGLISRGRVREAILEIPLIDGGIETIPDDALWAAVVCLGILASIWRYESENDGHEGIVKGAHKSQFTNIHGEPDEEPETIGIPRNIVIPFRQVCTRLGRALPYLSQADVSLHNFKIRDPTSIYPYPERNENLDLRWPIFSDFGERNFLICMAEVHGLFTPGPDLMARCQEMVMERDNDGLLVALIRLKEVVDQLAYVFHKISVNPHAGENFAPPASWGQGYAKFSAPLSKRVPALSGLFLPIFQCMDTFLMRTNYSSFLGIESVHLRAWMPLNVRAFVAALENHYPIVPYIQKSGDPRLTGVLDAIVESYAGEKGFMGTHRYKVYGFLEIVAKTGRVETNGGAGATDNVGRPWQEVHKTLAESMKERLEPYRSPNSLDLQPHELRGTYEECRFWANIVSRESIDDDPARNTGKVTLDVKNLGLTFIPGDRLAVMPLNAWGDVEKVINALGLVDLLDVNVPLDGPNAGAAKWKRYARHEAEVSKLDHKLEPRVTVRDVLRKGKLAPLTKEMVMNLHNLLRVSTSTLRVLGSDSWPVIASLGDLLVLAMNEVPQSIWDGAFPLSDLSWLTHIIHPEVPRTYSISSFHFDLLPETLDLTVARAEHNVSPLVLPEGVRMTRPGVSSGFLNPDPSLGGDDHSEEQVLVGINRPLNFQLPINPNAPVAMFAGGSGIAPFRGFWQARAGANVQGRNMLFLGVQSRERFIYKHELRQYVQEGKLELHVAFSRDSHGLIYDPVSRDLVERHMEPRYLDQTIIDNGPAVCDVLISNKLGGKGGYIFICGSVSLYETVMKGLRAALYKYRAVTKDGADELLSQAFAERRIMLDVFMTPRIMKEDEPYISMAQLARHTGHREGSRMWIGVHGSVYDVTDFLPIHPGGTLIVAGSAGIDASVTFDEVAHTTNPEVMSLLGKYFIGYLTPKPALHLPELSDIYDGWVDYMRTCVESLTTLSFEVDTLKKDSKLWFADGLLSTHAIRKLYQLQSRFLTKTGFPVLFGSRLQELFLKLSFSIANADDDSPLPDVVGTITNATSSPSALKAKKEIAELGEFVTNAATSAPAFERGIISYTRAVCELDVKFLETIREEICEGYEAFMRVADVVRQYPNKEKQALHKVASVLVGYLERIAERVDSFYVDLAAHSLYHPENEANPARARWNFVQRRVKDSSFFVLTRDMRAHSARDLDLDGPIRAQSSFEKKRANRQSISFDQVLSQAVSSVSKAKVGRAPVNAPPVPALPSPQSRPGTAHSRTTSHAHSTHSRSKQPTVTSTRPLRLADAHTARAQAPTSGPTSYEDQLLTRASNRISQFMTRRAKDINRLSKVPVLSLDHAMAMYGPPLGSGSTSGSDEDSFSSVSPVDDYPPARSAAPSSARGYTPTPQHSARQSPASATPPSSFGGRPPATRSNSSMTSPSVGPRSVKGAMSRSELHAATFSRKLSVYGGSQASTIGRHEHHALPPVPTKESHW